MSKKHYLPNDSMQNNFDTKKHAKENPRKRQVQNSILHNNKCKKSLQSHSRLNANTTDEVYYRRGSLQRHWEVMVQLFIFSQFFNKTMSVDTENTFEKVTNIHFSCLIIFSVLFFHLSGEIYFYKF